MSKRLQYFLIALIGFLILLIFILIRVAIYYATNTATKQSNTTNTVVSSTVVKQTNPAPQPAPQPAPTQTITTPANGYFNYYVEGEPKAYVITMSYKTSNVNSLPIKGSAELNQRLDEMTEIIKSLNIKIK